MRVLFGKFHCRSFICFCKPSLLSPSSLKLENTPHVPSPLSSVPDAVGQIHGERIEVKNDSFDGNQVENSLKSSLKKPCSEPGVQKETERKRVQWMDFLGKELVEVEEFEISESEDSDDDGEASRGCICVIQ